MSAIAKPVNLCETGFLTRMVASQYFEKVSLYCKTYGDLIPVSFILGFYVSIVVKRWWDSFNCIPWPDTLAFFVSAYVHGQDERGRLMRRSIMRYANLAFVITLTCISPCVKKRFPTMDHLVDAGILLPNEKKIMEQIKTTHSTYWMPLVWASSIAIRARKEGRVRDDFALNTLVEAIAKYRMLCGGLFNYDWISIPLVYTQVVTLVVYTFFLATLMGRQYLDPTQGHPGYDVDLYIPIFNFLQFFFYMGWLKVAETLVNPFGEDDDDFEVNWVIDRDIQVSYLIVDEMHQEHPELIKDQYWDEIMPDLPYTAAAMPFYSEPPMGSAANLVIPPHEAEFVPLEPLEENEDELDGVKVINGIPCETASNNRSRLNSHLSGSAFSGISKLGRSFHPMSYEKKGILNLMQDFLSRESSVRKKKLWKAPSKDSTVDQTGSCETSGPPTPDEFKDRSGLFNDDIFHLSDLSLADSRATSASGTGSGMHSPGYYSNMPVEDIFWHKGSRRSRYLHRSVSKVSTPKSEAPDDSTLRLPTVMRKKSTNSLKQFFRSGKYRGSQKSLIGSVQGRSRSKLTLKGENRNDTDSIAASKCAVNNEDKNSLSDEDITVREAYPNPDVMSKSTTNIASTIRHRGTAGQARGAVRDGGRQAVEAAQRSSSAAVIRRQSAHGKFHTGSTGWAASAQWEGIRGSQDTEAGAAHSQQQGKAGSAAGIEVVARQAGAVTAHKEAHKHTRRGPNRGAGHTSHHRAAAGTSHKHRGITGAGQVGNQHTHRGRSSSQGTHKGQQQGQSAARRRRGQHRAQEQAAPQGQQHRHTQVSSRAHGQRTAGRTAYRRGKGRKSKVTHITAQSGRQGTAHSRVQAAIRQQSEQATHNRGRGITGRDHITAAVPGAAAVRGEESRHRGRGIDTRQQAGHREGGQQEIEIERQEVKQGGGGSTSHISTQGQGHRSAGRITGAPRNAEQSSGSRGSRTAIRYPQIRGHTPKQGQQASNREGRLSSRGQQGGSASGKQQATIQARAQQQQRKNGRAKAHRINFGTQAGPQPYRQEQRGNHQSGRSHSQHSEGTASGTQQEGNHSPQRWAWGDSEMSPGRSAPISFSRPRKSLPQELEYSPDKSSLGKLAKESSTSTLVPTEGSLEDTPPNEKFSKPIEELTVAQKPEPDETFKSIDNIDINIDNSSLNDNIKSNPSLAKPMFVSIPQKNVFSKLRPKRATSLHINEYRKDSDSPSMSGLQKFFDRHKSHNYLRTMSQPVSPTDSEAPVLKQKVSSHRGLFSRKSSKDKQNKSSSTLQLGNDSDMSPSQSLVEQKNLKNLASKSVDV
ncbi:Bestrophin-3 like protein [Argiope bruennichi]|uniref:Bestrophin-3 like protein n=1 Tax=Argiope bruennichi TaxID=94029 RepID=A0A8T0ECD3_ARGBR|nr:Bestrophin-3 like protein [Argiope bruennichi]